MVGDIVLFKVLLAVRTSMPLKALLSI